MSTNANVIKHLVRSHSGLKILEKSQVTSPIYLNEPKWAPDKQYANCMECDAKFDFVNRKHHCRRCGRCLCKMCCSHKSVLPRMYFIDPVRQCTPCFNITQNEKDFFDKHVKVLELGGIFSYEQFQPCATDNSQTILFNSLRCQLTSDHKKIVFDSSSHQIKLDYIQLRDIQFCKVRSHPTSDTNGYLTPQGVEITYRSSSADSKSIVLAVLETSSVRRQAITWIIALQKAMKLVFESLSIASECNPMELS